MANLLTSEHPLKSKSAFILSNVGCIKCELKSFSPQKVEKKREQIVHTPIFSLTVTIFIT